ncbi:hypothetical protein DL89DRAFT_259839 [Linderina pennispora]|uniref:CSC1/OSCA1-like 7TM region domain-containing protein n=1 Tax=Linderina pennispora TaxID=61395 RepID=A0A1Y1VZM4_9FUNG|nr:uncharacterized protein DL89DRAFT_259839 [Linderina pennispora]ORX66709.1 hypothetical protein DL89DRAFT_259839 [Linderina pennispora]
MRIEHYTVAIEEIENTVNQVRRENHTFKPTTVGFVSYVSPLAAHDAMRGLKNVSPAVVNLAPHPKDVIWTNAQMPKSVRIARVWSARAISVLFCFVAFWPVAALTFIGDVTNIQALWPSTAEFFRRNDFISTIWQTTFSPLILTLYYIAVPHVFRAISRYQGIPTKTAVERAVVKKMYVFYILSNLIVLTLVGFVFWTAYVSQRGMNAMIEFAQPISLIMIFIKRYTRDLTPRELRDLTQPPDLDYAPIYSLYLWIYTYQHVLLGVRPDHVPVRIPGLCAGLLGVQTKFETGGDMWQSVVNRMVVSLVHLPGLSDRLYQVHRICTYSAARADMHHWLHDDEENQPAGPVHAAHPRDREASTCSGQLTTPVVDRRVRHLLSKVYRGRTSLFVDPNGPPPTQDSIETKFSGGTLTSNPSFISGGNTLEAQSMMDARDRRDFDGASTAMGMYSSGPGSREMVELLSMGNQGHNAALSPSDSRANLLGNAQPISLSRSPSPPSANGSSLSFGNLDDLDKPHDMNRDTFDPIDLYGGGDSSTNEKGHIGMLQQQQPPMPYANMAPPRYGQPGPRPNMMWPGPPGGPNTRPGPPGPRPNMMQPGPHGPPGARPMDAPKTTDPSQLRPAPKQPQPAAQQLQPAPASPASPAWANDAAPASAAVPAYTAAVPAHTAATARPSPAVAEPQRSSVGLEKIPLL